jgi:hypothetical protein
VDYVLTTSKNTAALNANGSKGSISVDSYQLRDSALDPNAQDLLESPAPLNHHVNQPESELNCIDQLMQDHIASCLARSVDPLPRESLQEDESHGSMYVHLPRLSNSS